MSVYSQRRLLALAALLLLPSPALAASGDTVADAVLGQRSFDRP